MARKTAAKSNVSSQNGTQAAAGTKSVKFQKEEKIHAKPEKSSARLQNLKTQQNFSNTSIEEVLRTTIFKNQITFADFVKQCHKDLLEPNKIGIDNELYYTKHFSSTEPENTASDALLNPTTSSHIQFSSQLLADNEDSKKAQEKYYSLAKRDFEVFIRKHHGSIFTSLNQLASITLEYFFANGQKEIPSSIEGLSYFVTATKTLSLCPSFFLTESHKEILAKIYFYNTQMYHEPLQNDFSVLLTAFEVLMDYYIFRQSLQSQNNKKKSEKNAQYEALLKDLSHKILFYDQAEFASRYSEEHAILLRVRASYALAKMFTLEAFNCQEVAKTCLALLEVDLRRIDEVITPNSQMLEKNIYMNIFWTKDKFIDNDRIGHITELLQVYEARGQLSVTKNTAVVEEQMGIDINVLFSIFDRKVKASFDDSIDLCYPKLFEKLSTAAFETFIVYFPKIVEVFLDIIFKKPEYEDTRKMIIHVYLKLKINSLLQLFLKHLEKKDVIANSLSNDTEIIKSLLQAKFLLLKAYCVNIVIDYILDFELMFDCFRKIGKILVKIHQSEFELAPYKFLRTLHTMLQMIPPERNKALYSKIEADLRQEAMLSGLRYLGLRFSSYFEKEQYEKTQQQVGLPEDEKILCDEIERDVIHFFAIWYGVSHKDLEQTQTAGEGVEFGPESFLDVLLFVKYAEYYTPEFLSNSMIKFKPAVSKYFQKVYKFLQKNESDWFLVCPGLVQIKAGFEEGLATGNIVVVDSIHPAEGECFCSNSNCLSKLNAIEPAEFKRLLSSLFFLCGKAFDDFRLWDFAGDVLSYRKQQLRMENMYAWNASLHRTDPHAWWRFAASLLEGHAIYSDQRIYPIVHEKLAKLGNNGDKARNAFLYALALAKSNSVSQNSLQFPSISPEATYVSLLIDFKILLLIESETVKFRRDFTNETHELVSDGSAVQSVEELNGKLNQLEQERQKLPVTEDWRDLYLTITFMENRLPMHFCYEENSKKLIQLKELKEKFKGKINSLVTEKSNTILNVIEARTQIYIMAAKMIRRYLYLIKYLQDASIDKKVIEDKLAGLNQSVSIEILQGKIFDDFEQLLSFLKGFLKTKPNNSDRESGGQASSTSTGREQQQMVPDSLKMVQEESKFDLGSFIVTNRGSIGYLSSRYKIEKNLEVIIEKIQGSIVSEFPIIDEKSFSKIYLKATEVIELLFEKFRKITSKKELKKFKGASFLTNSVLIMASFYEEILNIPAKALELLSDFFGAKCNEVVDIYKYEKDFKLGLLYNRDVVFMSKKAKIVEKYLRLAPYADRKDVLERCKLINKRASALFFAPEDQEKKPERINLAFWRIYTQTLKFILEDYSKFFSEELKNSMKPDVDEVKMIDGESPSKAIGLAADKIDEGLKAEMKYLNDLIYTSLKSKYISPIFRKQAELKMLLDEVLIKAMNYYCAKLDVHVIFSLSLAGYNGDFQSKDAKPETAIVFIEQFFKRKRGATTIAANAKKDEAALVTE